jgi:phenylpropionate dioxygenase-like ring-hydroxylating dioxygenase large terminal subunit
MELDFNWKLVIDTFLEPYHFSSLHWRSIGPFILSNLCMAESFGPHVWEALPRRSMLELREQPQESWKLFPHCIVVHVLFPNTVLIMLLDHIETWRIYPRGSDPARSVCYLDYYIPPDDTKSEEYWEKNWAQTVGTVMSEDFPAMAGIQRGLSTGVNTHLTVGSNEPALAMFERAVADHLG